MDNVTYKVEGINCSHCINTITDVLSQLEGVLNVELNFFAKTVFVEFDTNKETSESVKDIIDALGYKSELIN